jgi:hypothetical protein
MFRLNIRRPELAGFIAREKDDAPRLLRITFKHMALSPELSGSFPGQSSGPAPRISLTLVKWCNQRANRYTLYIAGLTRGYQLPKTPYLSFLRKQLQLFVSCDATVF